MDDATRRPPLAQCPAWKALAAHHEDVRKLHLRVLFAEDPRRGERLTLTAGGWFLDYSKNRVTDRTLDLLFRLARESDLAGRIQPQLRAMLQAALAACEVLYAD